MSATRQRENFLPLLAKDNFQSIFTFSELDDVISMARTCRNLFEFASSNYSRSSYGLAMRYILFVEKKLAKAADNTHDFVDRLLGGDSLGRQLSKILLSRKAICFYMVIISELAYGYINLPRLSNGEIVSLPQIQQLTDLQERLRLLKQVEKGFRAVAMGTFINFIFLAIFMWDMYKTVNIDLLEAIFNWNRAIHEKTRNELQQIIQQYPVVYSHIAMQAHAIIRGELVVNAHDMSSIIHNEQNIIKSKILSLLKQAAHQLIGTNRALDLAQMSASGAAGSQATQGSNFNFRDWCVASLTFYKQEFPKIAVPYISTPILEEVDEVEADEARTQMQL